MTEADWLACTDPQKMLEFLRGRASDRKLRLFGVACCYRIWHLIGHNEANRNGVAIAERYADGQAPLEELLAVNTTLDCCDDSWLAPTDYLTSTEISTVCQVAHEAAWLRAKDVLINRVEDVNRAVLSKQCGKEERQEQLCLLRDIFGNPFRPASLSPSWLTWSGGTIPQLAQDIYDDRDLPSGHFDNSRMAILADALEDAGRTDQDILGHCRGPGPHVRGCWAIDLLLGKQ
jgi:hypothetical protein